MSIGVNQTDKAVLFGKFEQNWIGNNTHFFKTEETTRITQRKKNPTKTHSKTELLSHISRNPNGDFLSRKGTQNDRILS